jgi:hypothetical protein
VAGESDGDDFYEPSGSDADSSIDEDMPKLEELKPDHAQVLHQRLMARCSDAVLAVCLIGADLVTCDSALCTIFAGCNILGRSWWPIAFCNAL